MYPAPGPDGDRDYTEGNDFLGLEENGDGSYLRQQFINVKTSLLKLT